MEEFTTPSPYIDITIAPRIIYGYYLYEWHDCHKPFYVGMGIRYRAWDPHSQATHKRMSNSSNFQIRIVRHRLTKKQAHILERQRILLRIKQGFSLTNQRIPVEC